MILPGRAEPLRRDCEDLVHRWIRSIDNGDFHVPRVTSEIRLFTLAQRDLLFDIRDADKQLVVQEQADSKMQQDNPTSFLENHHASSKQDEPTDRSLNQLPKNPQCCVIKAVARQGESENQCQQTD